MKLLSLFFFAILALVAVQAQDEAGPFVADTCVTCVTDPSCQYCESIQDTSDIYKCNCQFSSVNQDVECYDSPSECTSGAMNGPVVVLAALAAAAVPLFVW